MYGVAHLRSPERLAEPQALAAIALQVRQSLWRSRSSDPLDHAVPTSNRMEKKMIWKSIVRPRAIASRRRFVATALVYGLSLAVRFTSAAGEETEVPPQAAQGTYPMTSIVINDGARTFYKDWPRLAQPGLPSEAARQVKAPWQCR
jgi:hypothetical protein